MTKEFCDLCGRELYNGQNHRRFKIKELKPDDRFRPVTRTWLDIVAHNRCIEALLSLGFLTHLNYGESSNSKEED